ncbi:MAG: polysaccharide biosynthesis protein, partial [Puniceicoccales bacterium]|nr:polysaccharide biosynthesis protein [Puniceicoccales bacterium]
MKTLQKLFGYSSFQRTAGLLLVYIAVLSGALLLAFASRFLDVGQWPNVIRHFTFTAVWLVPIQIAFLSLFKHFSGVFSYFRMPDLVRLFQALACATLVTIAVVVLSGGTLRKMFPLSIVLNDLLYSLAAVAALRVAFRVMRERYSTHAQPDATGRKWTRVAILGAGDAGASLAADWLARPSLRRVPVVFLDDDASKHGLRIHDIPVAGAIAQLKEAREKFAVTDVVIAIGNPPAHRIQEVITLARNAGLKAEIVPSLTELATGQVRASRIRPVEIQDLLGRQTIALDGDGIREMILGKTVLVTGAGGSIGSELCRQIAARAPGCLLLVERCEVQIFQVEQNLIELGFGANIQPLVGDITDEARMRHILNLYKPDVIFHAAAHKHVFMMERQPWEAIKNNTLGTRLLINLAIEYEVARFVLISTDKAINPTNVMGATKRMAEMCLQARQANGTGKTKLMAVRFGNVLGSSGSVIPIFQKQIAAGGPVKVTHPDVIRYFMTIPEAVGLVLQCAVLGQGGEIFVLNMGKPVKIADLARQMIELSGFRPDVDIPIEFIGLRPGEKLFEELQHVGETHQATEHPEIMRFVSTPPSLENIERAL